MLSNTTTGLACNKLDNAVSRGVDFLLDSQLPSGEMRSYRSRHPEMTEDCQFDSSPFPSALIASSLNFSDSAKAKTIVGKIAHFLLSEMEPGGVWRYWTSKHPYHKNIPPDIDDIVCASSVLQQSGIIAPQNRALILSNLSSKKVLYTWIVPRLTTTLNATYWQVVLREALNPVNLYMFWKLNEAEPNDTDGVVNANALYYLGKCPETMAIIQFLIDIINDEREEKCDKWHLSRFNLYYALSRNYFAGIKDFECIRAAVVDRILAAAQPNGQIGAHLLDTALAVCSLFNWGIGQSSPVLERAVQLLVKEQTEPGAWQKFPLYYGGPKRYFGWGSEELTTGFCIEALTRYRNDTTPGAEAL